MGKTALCIRMLEELYSGRTLNADELAEILETNKRNIPEYKKELEEAGYEIETVMGKYGGYRLVRDKKFLSTPLGKKEKEALNASVKYIESQQDFVKKADFMYAIGKILSNYYEETKPSDVLVLNRFPLAMSDDELKKRYDAIEHALKEQLVIEIDYESTKNKVRCHKVHPYKLYIYNNSWFFLAWNETLNQVGYFKLNRIQSYRITNQKFTVLKTFNPSDYLDDFGMKQFGDYFHISFLAKNQYANLVKERIYGKNQVVTPIDDKTTKIEVDMQGKENITVFILGFHENATVLEPEWLIENLKEYSKFIDEEYK